MSCDQPRTTVVEWVADGASTATMGGSSAEELLQRAEKKASSTGGWFSSTQSKREEAIELYKDCLLYTSPSPRDGLLSRMPSSA